MGEITSIQRRVLNQYEVEASAARHPSSNPARKPIIVAAIAKGGVPYERVGVITQPNGMDPFCRWQTRIPKPNKGFGEGVKYKELLKVREIDSKEMRRVSQAEKAQSKSTTVGLLRSL